MAVLRGGPTLPKRAENMSHNISTPAATTTKRKHRTTKLLANFSDEPDDMACEQRSVLEEDLSDDITVVDTDVDEDIKPCVVVSGGATAVPVSDMRSPSYKRGPAAIWKSDDDADGIPLGRVRKVLNDCADVKPLIQPSTPKKARYDYTAASSSKEVIKTPTKKSASTTLSTPPTPTTPREQAPLASAWQPEHWNDLNFAILKVVHEHASELYDASPSLTPWRIKGRLLVKLRQLLKEANGGDVASKRWDVELKPIRVKASPKKQPQ